MGKINQGILGGFSGKVGTVVGSTWKSINYMRALAVSVHNPNTVKQQCQRGKFRTAAHFCKAAKPFIQNGFREYASKQTPVNAAMSYLLRYAVEDCAEEASLDFDKVRVSQGSLTAVADAAVEVATGKATFEVDFGGDFLANTDNNGHLINVEITSTNQDVIPAEAIDGADKIGDSAYTEGATFTVDLAKISLGSTTLIFEDTQGHRTITRYVQVVENGAVYPGNIIHTTLAVKFDFDEGDLTLDEGIDPEKLVVQVSVNDTDWVDGTDPACGVEEYTQARFLLSDTGIKTFAMPYVEGHRYLVNVSLFTYTNNYETDNYPEFSQVYGNTLYLYDYVAGAGNSIRKDGDGRAWLNIANATSTVTLTVNVE